MVPGVLFDFDGVVVDSLSLHMRAWDHICKDLLFVPLELELRESIIGCATREIARILLARSEVKNLDVAEVVRRKNEWLRGHAHEIPILPGAREMMQELAERGIPFGIASNASRPYLLETVKRFDLKVPIVLGLEDYNQPKPAPEPYLKLAKMLNIGFMLHERVLVFEDSTHGLKAAVQARMHPVGVLTQHKADVLIGAGAKTTCDNLLDALQKKILDGNY